MAAPGANARPRLRPAMGFRDLVLFFVISGFSVRWTATAAAGGASSIVVWLIGCAAMYVPLALSVVELASRYPDEGGMYVWSRKAFGDFAAFMTGWTYWTSNLPYFPGVLYFAAGNALVAFDESWQALADSGGYFISVALLGLALATVLNVAGLNVGKWLNSAGAVGGWLTTLVLIVVGLYAFAKHGSATEISAATLRPGTQLKDILFWSTIAFALTGLEAASFMGEEIRDARRSIPRAIAIAAPFITLVYMLGSVSILVALPVERITGLQGVMHAIREACERVGLTPLVPFAAACVTINCLGSVGAWLGAVARIPFVAGLDRFLPEAFGRVHPRWGSPHVALLTQSAITVVFIVLGQAGTTVRGAYDVLVSMGIIAYFVPFLFLFAAMIKLQREPAGPGVARVPGGRPVAVVMATVGFLTTAGSIGLALVPSPSEPNKPLAVAKLLGLTALLLGSGVLVYLKGRRRALGR